MLSKYKSIFDTKLSKFAKHFSWLDPNILTILGLIPQMLFVWFMAQESYGWALLMLILAPLDMLDGILARANNRVTQFGAFFDSTLDRIGDFLLIYGLFLGRIISLEIMLGLILCSFLISYSRARAELASDGKMQFNYGIIERPERLILIGIAVFLWCLPDSVQFNNYFLADIVIFILLVLSIITVFQRFWIALKKLSY